MRLKQFAACDRIFVSVSSFEPLFASTTEALRQRVAHLLLFLVGIG
jgi:hypothetical protein